MLPDGRARKLALQVHQQPASRARLRYRISAQVLDV